MATRAARPSLPGRPFLHLDLPLAVPAAERAVLTARLAGTYAEIMETGPQRVSVAFRELGENGVLRVGDVEPVIVLQCDIRRRAAT